MKWNKKKLLNKCIKYCKWTEKNYWLGMFKEFNFEKKIKFFKKILFWN